MRRVRLWLQRKHRLVELLIATVAEADVLRAERDVARRAEERLAGELGAAQGGLAILKAVLVEAEGDVDRLTRERDSWRRRAERVPLTLVEEETARRERQAEAERTGGR